MPTYLSRTAIYLTPTPEIRALNNKSIVVVEDGHRLSASIAILDADRNSPNAGLCCILLSSGFVEDASRKWGDSNTAPPTPQSHQWQRYLTEEALPLIRANKEDPNYGEVLLEIPKQV